MDGKQMPVRMVEFPAAFGTDETVYPQGLFAVTDVGEEAFFNSAIISEAGLSDAFFMGCGLLERKRFAIEPIPPSECFIIKVLQQSFKDRTSEEDFSWYYL